MKCSDVRDRIAAAIDPELDAHLSEHLAQCSGCCEYHAVERLLRDSARQHQPATAPEFLTSDIMHAWQEEKIA